MEMSPVVGVLIFVVLFFLPRLLKKKSDLGGDDGGLLDDLSALSSAMTAAGFKLLPQLPDALMKNDKSYVNKLIRQLMMAFNNPEQRQAELEEVFTKLLEEKFKDPDRRRALLDRIERLKTAEQAKPVV